MATSSSPHLLHLPFSLARPPSPSNRPFSTASPPLRPLPTVTPLRSSGPPFLCHTLGYNVQIVVGEDEPEEALLRRFRREVSRAGVIQECKRRRFFENKQEEKKRKAREAGRRNRRRRFGPRFQSASSSAASNSEAGTKKSEDGDDNWDMPEGDVPF